MSVKKIEESDFEEVIKNDTKKVLVDCYADWCGPCQMLGPVIESLSEEIDNVEFYKLNIDNAMEVASKYQIMSIPTLLIFENGSLKEKLIGFQTADELREKLK